MGSHLAFGEMEDLAWPCRAKQGHAEKTELGRDSLLHHKTRSWCCRVTNMLSGAWAAGIDGHLLCLCPRLPLEEHSWAVSDPQLTQFDVAAHPDLLMHLMFKFPPPSIPTFYQQLLWAGPACLTDSPGCFCLLFLLRTNAIIESTLIKSWLKKQYPLTMV